ncbi:MAG: CoB--CoM heterodisulfide reductase iron-sulfur subunit B family protein [Methanosarcinales archaeon]
MKYNYYPGCVLHASATDYEDSVQAVCKYLDIELEEIKNWNCCGATHVHTVNKELSIALSLRNLAKAKEIVTPCNVCFSNLKIANKSLEDKEIKKKMSELIKYNGNTKVRHLLEVILEDIGLEEINKKVKKPLELKVVPYYGCLLTRPDSGFDSPENPISLDKLITALGGTPVNYNYKTKCCGGPIFVTQENVALELAFNLIQYAKKIGADCMAVACPLCHAVLDAKQPEIEKKFDVKLNFPILYFTQLMGLAFNLDRKELGLNKHIVPFY